MKPIKFVLLVLVLLAGAVAAADLRDDYFAAVDNDNADVVATLLGNGFDPNTPDKDGQVGLFLALRAESPRVVDALLRSPKTDVNSANAAGETPLMMAALRGNLVQARALVARGAHIDRDGWTPLHYAATGPSTELVAYLLDKGATIDARSPNGTTPLMMAARYGNPASAQLLLERGADKRLRNQRGLDAADFAKEVKRDDLAARLRAE